jgi:hypothetical protein
MSVTNQYTLGKQKQLIDLNGDSVNFDLNFFCESLDGSEFDVLVVDQQTLDSNPNNLSYKHAQGKISGNISSDKNIYQNYFLILKADHDCQVNVMINKQVLPFNQNTQQPQQGYPQQPRQGYPQQPQQGNPQQPRQGYPQQQHQQGARLRESYQQPQQHQPNDIHKEKGGGINFKMIFIVILIAGGLFFLFKFKKSSTQVSNESNFQTPQVELASPAPSTPSVSSPVVEPPKITSSLLSKLEKISSIK